MFVVFISLNIHSGKTKLARIRKCGCNSNSGTQLRVVREENLKSKWNNIWDERGENRIEDKLRIEQGREIKGILRQRRQEERKRDLDREGGAGGEKNRREISFLDVDRVISYFSIFRIIQETACLCTMTPLKPILIFMATYFRKGMRGLQFLK